MARTPQCVWRRNLDRVYNDQILSLTVNREIYRQARQAWSGTPNNRTAADLAWWMTQTYIAFVATTIRRVSEPPPRTPRKGQRTLSLVVILHEMLQHRRLLSREWYTKKYANTVVSELADRDFDMIAGRKNARWIPANRIHSDTAKIRSSVAPLKRLADKAVAHTEVDRRKLGRPTWQKVDLAIDTVVEVYERYHLLLTATSFDPMGIAERTDVSSDLRKIWPT